MVVHQPIAAAPPAAASLRIFLGDFAAFAGRRRWLAGALLAAGALVEGIGLLMLLPLLSVLLDGSTGQPWLDGFTAALTGWVPDGSRAVQLAVLIGLFALLMALRAVVILARDVVLARLHIGFVEHHRMRIIELLAGSSWPTVSRLRHGRITHILGTDVQECGDAANLALHCCVAAAMLTGQAVLVLLLSPLLAALVLGLLLAAALLVRPAMRRARTLGARLTESNLALASDTTQFLGGLKLALSQGLTGGFVREFGATLREAGDQRVQFVRQRVGAQLLVTGLAAAVGGLTLLLGIGLVDAAPATLIAFLFILARMNGPVMQMQSAAQHVFHALPAYAKIKTLQAELAPFQEARDDVSPRPDRRPEPIELRGVGYRYETGGGVSELDLPIAPGSFVGLVGASGAGKTTLADLLVGLYPPQSGEIRVGGAVLTGAAVARWRETVSYVSQDPFLFHDTIRRNLEWARPGAGEPELWAAIELAGAGPLVRRLGLDAVVGERGGLVSGGERQRIALARAFIRRPGLLVLDEATNAIDQEGEQALLKRIAALPERPTVVMIAHRASSLAFCDRLIALDGGRLVEGTAS